MDAAMDGFWPNGCIKRIGVCEIFVYNNQPVTHQTRIKDNYTCNKETLVIYETLTNVKFVGHNQQAM